MLILHDLSRTVRHSTLFSVESQPNQTLFWSLENVTLVPMEQKINSFVGRHNTTNRFVEKRRTNETKKPDWHEEEKRVNKQTICLLAPTFIV